MPYILHGTRDLIGYWNTLGRPCSLNDLADATRIPKINFMGTGKTRTSFTARYGIIEANRLAGRLGVTVANVNTNGGQALVNE